MTNQEYVKIIKSSKKIVFTTDKGSYTFLGPKTRASILRQIKRENKEGKQVLNVKIYPEDSDTFVLF